MSNSSLTYRDAGVDIEAGEALVDTIKPIARSTLRDGCLGALGGFGGLFEIPEKFTRPVLVSGTDGVGTKLKYAFELDRHDTIGIDLVAMCANDVLVQGAEPLFFLDYFATGRLCPEVAAAVIAGIGAGCREAGAALIGGETAEMPGMYAEGEYDLAGFCVGAVERDRILDGSAIGPGDILIALPSSGPHANGYSLIRRIVAHAGVALDTILAGQPLSDHLLTPTRLYVRPVLDLLDAVPVHGLAHITGGGLPGNVRRILPSGTRAVIAASHWRWPPIFHWLQEFGSVARDEMYRTFNCGIGLVAVVAADAADAALARLARGGENALVIGAIESGPTSPDVSIVN